MAHGSRGLAMESTVGCGERDLPPKAARNAAHRRMRRETPPGAEGGAKRRPAREALRAGEQTPKKTERRNTMGQNTTLTGFVRCPAPVSVLYLMLCAWVF